MTTLIVLVLLSLCINIGIVVWCWHQAYNWSGLETVMSLLYSALAWVVIALPVGLAVQATEGLLPEYSTGYREGVIMKVSNKGVIWKTNEILLALGSDKATAFQEPVPFSIVDSDVLKSANRFVGERVTVHYNEWLLMPFRVGESGKEVTSIALQETQ